MKQKIFIILITITLFSTMLPISLSEKGTIQNNTIYVDDDNTMGPWDGSADHPYQYIQQAIDNATDGDTIYVANGYYNEKDIFCNISVSLIGENQEQTILDGYINETFDSFFVLTSRDILITQFTFKNYGLFFGGIFDENSSQNDGFIHCEYNIFKDTYLGILIFDFSGNSDISISHNYLQTDEVNSIGILCDNFGPTSTISHNIIDGFSYGLFVRGNALVEKNQISGSSLAGVIAIDDFNGNIIDISQNNFIDNTIDANILYYYSITRYKNRSVMSLPDAAHTLLSKYYSYKPYEPKGLGDINLNQNYYDSKKGIGPKFIIGEFSISLNIHTDEKTRHFLLPLPWLCVDWNPAKEPFDIN